MRRVIFLALIVIAGVGVTAMIVTLRQATGGPDPSITTRMRLRQIAAASEAFHTVYGRWPTGFVEFTPEHNFRTIAFLPSGEWTTNDAWHRPLLYRPFDPARGYGAVVSFGRDGRVGGDAADSDYEERFSDTR